MQRSELLAVGEVTKVFGGHRAVDGISFTLTQGGITGLVGPNGAGKTTLFNCLAGHFAPTAGRITLAGAEIAGASADRIFAAGLARTFQIPRPFAAMTVLENVMVAAPGQPGEQFWRNWLQTKAVAQAEREVRERARHWLDFLGLSALENEAARVLSGGQRKLLELARVLMAEPKLVLLDEPAAGVNPALLDVIVDKVRTLNRDGMSFLLIEHNMDVVASLCDPVLVMAEGKLLAQGAPRDVLADPRVIEAYLGERA